MFLKTSEHLFGTPGISYVMWQHTLLVMVKLLSSHQTVMLFCQDFSLSLMVKLLLGRQGMFPLPVPAKVVVVVSEKNYKEIGNHSFNLLLTHLHETRDTEEEN